MTRVRCGFAALVAALTVTACTGSDTHHGRAPHSVAVDAAVADFAAIRSGHCDRVTEHFDSAMRARLSARDVCAAWHSYTALFGNYVSHGTPRLVRVGTERVVQIALHLRKRDGEFRVTFDRNGRIAGLYLLRTGVPL